MHNAKKSLRLAALAAALAASSAAPAQVGTLADSNGVVRAWGWNNFGQTNVPAGSFKAIAGGYGHSVGILADGSALGWGWNRDGQAIPQPGSFTAVSASDLGSLALRSDGSVLGWGTKTSQAGTFTAIAAGYLHSIALRSDGSILGWKDNMELGNAFGQAESQSGVFTAIAAGDRHNLAIRADGSILGWGRDNYGQAASQSGVFTAIACGGFNSLAVRADGSILGWGDNQYGQTDSQSGVFTAVATGYQHSLALKADGSVYGWGRNQYGQANSQSGIYVAIAAGAYHSLALEARSVYTGDLRIYGSNVTSTLNRSLSVAGDLTVETTTSLYNTPVATVAGKASFTGGGLKGVGAVNVGGGVSLTGLTTISGGASLSSVGAVSGSGTLLLRDGARATFGLTPLSAHTGGFEIAGGTLRFNGMGEVGASIVRNSGEIRLDGGQRMVATGWVANAGNLYLRSAEFEALGKFDNSKGTGLVSGAGATLRFGGGLTNEGALALTAGPNDVYGDVANTGSVTVTGGASATFYDDFVNNGTLTVRKLGSSVSDAVFLGSFSGAGSVTGGGNVFLEGDLKPGNSPARVSFGANLALGGGVRTEIEIAGLASGRYDRVEVSGDLALDGTLDVRLLDGFALAAGQSFTIFTAGGSLSGGFQGLSDGALVGSFGGQGLYVGYGLRDVRLYTAPVPEPASMVALGFGALAMLRRRKKA